MKGSQNSPKVFNSPKIHPGISTDFLWVWIVLAGFLFFTSLVPLAPNDYWWHLRIGQIIHTEQSIPTTNLFGWSVPSNQPFFYGAWLAEWLFYILHEAGGLAINIFTRTILVGVAFLLVAIESRRRSGSWRIAALMLAFAGLMSSNNLLVRTQIWAFLPFIITFSLLSRYEDGQLRPAWLISCPILMIFWVNLHGSFVLGLGLVGIFLFGNLLRHLRKHPLALSKHRLAWLAAVGGLSFVSILANPRFASILSYVNKLLTDPPSQKLIEEWQSPTPGGLANTVFFISIVILLGALAYTKQRQSPTNLLLIAGFLWLAWSGQRYVIWYGMIAMPVLAQIISSIKIDIPHLTPTRNWINLLIAIIIFIPVILVQPWLVERFPLPDTYWSQIQNDPEVGVLLSTRTPIGAARYLQTKPGGRLYNELGYGSYLIWAVPEQAVFVDPRIELYPQHIWEDYINISNGVRSLELIDAYAINRIILDINLQPELSTILASNPVWRLEYQDKISQIWTRQDNP